MYTAGVNLNTGVVEGIYHTICEKMHEKELLNHMLKKFFVLLFIVLLLPIGGCHRQDSQYFNTLPTITVEFERDEDFTSEVFPDTETTSTSPHPDITVPNESIPRDETNENGNVDRD